MMKNQTRFDRKYFLIREVKQLFNRYVNIHDTMGISSGLFYNDLEKRVQEHGKKGLKLVFCEGLDPNDLLEEMPVSIGNYAWFLMRKRRHIAVTSNDIIDAIDHITRMDGYRACKILELIY